MIEQAREWSTGRKIAIVSLPFASVAFALLLGVRSLMQGPPKSDLGAPLLIYAGVTAAASILLVWCVEPV